MKTSVILMAFLASSAYGDGPPTEPTAADPYLFPGPKLTRAARVVNPATPLYFQGFPVENFVARDFGIVAKQVTEMVESFFGGNPPGDTRPIVISLSKGQLARTDATSDPKYVHIIIVLNDDDLKQRNYCRFVYQLSHELGHHFFDARRSNGLIETLCDTLQYRVHKEMTSFWKFQYATSRDLTAYADRFPEYWRARAEKKMTCLTSDDRLPANLKDRTPSLDADFNGAKAHGLRQVAAMAMPETTPWDEFIGVAAWTDPPPSEDGKYRDDLETDLSKASQSMIPSFANGHAYRNPQLPCPKRVTLFFRSARSHDLRFCPQVHIGVTI